MCGIWDAFKPKQLSNQETCPLLPPNRAVPSSSRISSNQETRPPLPPNRTHPQTAPPNKTATPSPANTSIRSSPMLGLSDLQLNVVEPKVFQCLFDLITTQHLCRLQAMHNSRVRGELKAASRLLRRAVSLFSQASNRRLANIVAFEPLFKQITKVYLPKVQALFDQGERNEAITLLTLAKSALVEAFEEHGWSNHPVS